MIERDPRPRSSPNKLSLAHWAAFYRDQARLIWEWRATRLSLVRRAILFCFGTMASLLIISTLSPNLKIDSPLTLVLAAFALTVLNAATRPVLLLALSPLPAVAVPIAGILIQLVFILLIGGLLPGIQVGSIAAAIADAVMLSILNALLAETLRASDDDSFHGTQVRRLAAREFGKPEEPTAGLLMIQIDGLSLPVLQNAMRAGRMPTLDRLIRHGESKLDPWFALLPPVTPVSQAGILYGNNDDMPGFRWFEKRSDTLLVANTPEGATEINRRLSDGHGLLADDGASIGNLLNGDAARSYLTMATIEEPPSPEDPRRLRGIFVSQVNYIRLLVLTIGEVVKELYQRERQRARGIEPRIHRDLSYAMERALTNVALRNLTTALVIEEMFAGAPAIYVDYTGYDALAHHAGPERAESFDALDGIDRTIGSMLKAARETPRPYRFVVLSDHGQCLGTPFSEVYGELLEDVARRLMGIEPGAAAIPPAEFQHVGELILGEFGRGSSARARATRLARRVRRRAATAPDPGELVAAASGNLVLLYLTVAEERLDRDQIDRLYPDLIPGLLAHSGVAVVLVHSEADGPIVLGRDGQHDLESGRILGRDPLGGLGLFPEESLRRIDGFQNTGDLCVIGPYDEATGEVVSYEGLVGSHGGLGGHQQEPFLLHPMDLPVIEERLVGAPAVHVVLCRWLRSLAQDRPDADPGGSDGSTPPSSEAPAAPDGEPSASSPPDLGSRHSPGEAVGAHATAESAPAERSVPPARRD
ncbi:MAG: phage holin family protein [Chloroflexota bacterium]